MRHPALPAQQDILNSWYFVIGGKFVSARIPEQETTKVQKISPYRAKNQVPKDEVGLF